MGIERLGLYPFERLESLLKGVTPAAGVDIIDCTIGEPQHTPPAFIIDAHNQAVLKSIGKYPKTRQIPELSSAIAGYMQRNEDVALSSKNILALAGSGEGIYSMPSFALFRSDGQKKIIGIPNPGYKVYEGATVVAKGIPHFIDLHAHNNFQPDLDDIDDKVLDAMSLMYLNYPSNPCAVNATDKTLENAIELAQKHDFILASDECYADIYFGERPSGILKKAQSMGIKDFHNILAFNSLSKRSSVPGMRSGFVAGDPELISQYLKVRMMERKTVPLHVQHASVAAWNDDAHVEENRRLYAEKLDDFCRIVRNKSYEVPESTFYVWLNTAPVSDESFAKSLYAKTGVKVLPGSYLGSGTENPGKGYVRIALVHDKGYSAEAALRLHNFIPEQD